MSAELKKCVTWFIYFLDLLWVWYDCAKFHHCRICVTDFSERGPFWPPHPWAAAKKPILNRVNERWSPTCCPVFPHQLPPLILPDKIYHWCRLCFNYRRFQSAFSDFYSSICSHTTLSNQTVYFLSWLFYWKPLVFRKGQWCHPKLKIFEGSMNIFKNHWNSSKVNIWVSI